MASTYNLSVTLDFLSKIDQNNNREWFTAHKDEYQSACNEMISLADGVLAEMHKHDQIETPSGKKSLFRIYRDVRFSKNKLPYKNNLGGGFRRATKYLRGGYYFQIQPGNTFVEGGFWGPNPQDLLHIRKQITADPDSLRAVLEEKKFKDAFGTLQGEKVKTSPKGFSIEDSAIDLLRHKQFIVTHHFTDKEVLSKYFHLKIANTFVAMRPFFDYMSEILTTDLNGVERVDL
ncbi:DUF2461 domain-containing protein [Reichenbachiella sp. MALMAid0571]|uniref:DUF2461 domain-containing protein n=1 Tax=Reichenbachiella sp. MALMAid0571 TaxID=3143939 RepID=UPI0032DE4184